MDGFVEGPVEYGPVEGWEWPTSEHRCCRRAGWAWRGNQCDTQARGSLEMVGKLTHRCEEKDLK